MKLVVLAVSAVAVAAVTGLTMSNAQDQGRQDQSRDAGDDRAVAGDPYGAAADPTAVKAPPRNQRPKFALVDSEAASAAGAIPVTTGLQVVSQKGEAIGKVEQIFANRKGRVASFKVNMGDRFATLPAFYLKLRDQKLVSVLDGPGIRKAISLPFILDKKYDSVASAPAPE